MVSPAQLRANRVNALRSTGPRTEQGKARSALNAVGHGLTGRTWVSLPFGAFGSTDTSELEAFADDVHTELAPQTALEQAEVMNIVALLIRRARLPQFEAMAIAHGTRADLLPPDTPGSPPRIAQHDLTRAGANALSVDLFDRLPRYEAHLNRELDRAYTRYDQLRTRRQTSIDINGDSPAR